MKTTINEAKYNGRRLSVTKLGNGHYKIGCLIRNRMLYCISTLSWAVDAFNAEPDERENGMNRVKYGYTVLVNEIARNGKPPKR